MEVSMSEPKMGKILSPKASAISFGQQTSQSFIHINEPGEEKSIQVLSKIMSE